MTFKQFVVVINQLTSNCRTITVIFSELNQITAHIGVYKTPTPHMRVKND